MSYSIFLRFIGREATVPEGGGPGYVLSVVLQHQNTSGRHTEPLRRWLIAGNPSGTAQLNKIRPKTTSELAVRGKGTGEKVMSEIRSTNKKEPEADVTPNWFMAGREAVASVAGSTPYSEARVRSWRFSSCGLSWQPFEATHFAPPTPTFPPESPLPPGATFYP